MDLLGRIGMCLILPGLVFQGPLRRFLPRPGDFLSAQPEGFRGEWYLSNLVPT